MAQQRSRHERRDDEQDSLQGETARTNALNKDDLDKMIEEIDALLPEDEEEIAEFVRNYKQKGGQ